MLANQIFNWSNFFSFLIGLGVGLVAFALIYLLIVLTSINQKKYIVKSEVNDVTDEEIKEIIKASQNAFKDKNLKGEESSINYCMTLSKELVVHIASRFFPKSKHPVYEISIDELILLFSYISSRVDEILGRRGLRFVRKVKISQIVALSDTKKMIEDHPIVKATKKYKVYETISAAKKVINFVNPLWYARKFITGKLLGTITNKLCVVIIGIVGEETYKIYSKSVFNQDVEIDTGIDNIVNGIDQDIENNLSDEDHESYLKAIEDNYVDSESKKEEPKRGLFGFGRRKKGE